MGILNKRIDIIAIVLFFMFAIMLEQNEAFSVAEDETLSYRQLLRTYYGDEEVTTPSEDVVIVYTDEAFYEEYDMFPLRRVDLSTLIVRLNDMGAAVIAVDMLLDFNSAYGEDPTLNDAFLESGKVQLVSQAQFGDDGHFDKINKAIPAFAESTFSGYSNISSNSAISEKIVRLRLYPEINESVGEWPYSVQAVASYLGTDDISIIDNMLRIGDDLEVQLDQFNDLYIDYPLLPPNGSGGTAKLHEVVGITASEILFVDEEELEDLSFLVDGKIILIGEVAEVAHDEFVTPVGSVYGVEIIAETITTILRGGPLKAAPFGLEILLAIIMMAALLATRLLSQPLPRNIVSFGFVVVYCVGVIIAYISMGLVISMIYVLLASFTAIAVINVKFYLTEMGQKAVIKDAFGQYLSPAVVADLVKDPGKLALGGEERVMTAYFSDIASFSSFSENMTASELVLVLNEYLTAMCNIIIGLEGTVDKFEGDAIIAFWGAPAIQEDHAKLACFAAIDMNNALVPLREKWASEGRPIVNVRMGLNTGKMVVGNMGSAQRMDYTMMGDAVNLAARLEGANKAYGSYLMISESTYLEAKDHIDVRELDTIRVVGKSEAVKVYHLIERKGKTVGLMADLVVQYEKGHALYKARDFVGAKAAFKLALAIEPTDGPSATYVKRCDLYIASPPAEDWDGVYQMTDKG
ncbi:MAG: adenylate cyclase [Candidatus Azotimanducaceae bacterium]|jgi:adenylate cyclase